MKLDEFFASDSRANAYQSHRKEKIRGDIAERLRRVCADLPEAEFQALVDEMADRQLRGERRLSDL